MRSPIHLLPGGGRLLVIILPPLAGVAAVGCAFFFTQSPLPPSALPGPAPAAAQPPVEMPAGGGAGAVPAPGGLLVDVSGAVARPGLYRLNKGERAYAAIEAAGGLSPDADRSRLPNLASLLKDGQQIKIPFKTGASGKTTTATPRLAAVDLNQAPLEELLAVPGFDGDLARAVLEYRTQYGGFASIRELVTILGMGEAEYTMARKYVRV